jgi:hypothetical protein
VSAKLLHMEASGSAGSTVLQGLLLGAHPRSKKDLMKIAFVVAVVVLSTACGIGHWFDRPQIMPVIDVKVQPLRSVSDSSWEETNTFREIRKLRKF